MNMKHKGYLAHVEYDQEDKILIGRVVGIRDGINFHGNNGEEIEAAFIDAVDDYLVVCEELGQKPEKPYSGKISLRVPAEVHAAVASAAETKGESVNQWIRETLEAKISAVG
jgi:predicted HicB family RNase H-like nuclease